MSNLFVYGSLMYEPVWRRIVRGEFQSTRASLRGYRRLCVVNEDYPAIVKGAGIVAGLVFGARANPGIRRRLWTSLQEAQSL